MSSNVSLDSCVDPESVPAVCDEEILLSLARMAGLNVPSSAAAAAAAEPEEGAPPKKKKYVSEAALERRR